MKQKRPYVWMADFEKLADRWSDEAGYEDAKEYASALRLTLKYSGAALINFNANHDGTMNATIGVDDDTFIRCRATKKSFRYAKEIRL